MVRPTFLWRLYASYVAIIILLATLTAVIGASRVRSQSLESMSERLLDEAYMVHELLQDELAQADPHLQRQVDSIGNKSRTRFTLIASDGKVIADTDQVPARMNNHLEREEIVEARNAGVGSATRVSETLGIRTLYVAIPSYEGDQLVGYVRTALPTSLIDTRVDSLQNSILVSASLAAFVALLIGFLFARRATGPLRAMTEAAESIAAGNFDQDLRANTRDEFGALAIAFNRMSRRLREHVNTIEADRNKIFAILRSMQEAVIAIDTRERIVHINEAAGNMFRIDVSGVIGQPVWEILRQNELLETLSRTLKSGDAEQGELRIRRALRDQVLELHSSVLVDNQGERAGALVVLSDATELRHLESIRSEFVSNVSHEMKTPVAAIKGLVESILDDPEMNDEVRSNFLERIEQQCVRVSNLVNDLLGLASAERGMSVEIEPISLGGICRSCVRSYIDHAAERDLTLVAEISGEPIVAMADAEAMRQITDNLLTNAIRYTPDGGRIVVRLFPRDGKAVLEVQDNGMGIEPVHQERIFERFYRVDKARSRELGGTGLGLAIVKHLAQSMHGEVQLESNPGAGSLFRVLLPLYEG